MHRLNQRLPGSLSFVPVAAVLRGLADALNGLVRLLLICEPFETPFIWSKCSRYAATGGFAHRQAMRS